MPFLLSGRYLDHRRRALAFFWALTRRQFEDPDGDAARILRKDYDQHPKD